jgi:small-conductance mechanosensitive channel
MAAEVREAATARASLEASIKALAAQADQEQRARDEERSKLQGLIDEAKRGRVVPRAVPGMGALAEETASLGAELDRLYGERDTAVRQWKAETDRIAMLWQQERQGWIAEREAMDNKVV